MRTALRRAGASFTTLPRAVSGRDVTPGDVFNTRRLTAEARALAEALAPLPVSASSGAGRVDARVRRTGPPRRGGPPADCSPDLGLASRSLSTMEARNATRHKPAF